VRLCYLTFAGKLFYFIAVITEGKQILVADYSFAVKIDQRLVTGACRGAAHSARYRFHVEAC